jgi:hypothetical protein
MGLEGRREVRESTNSGLISVTSRLSDADLLRRLLVLAGRERESTVELVAHLAELDARRLHLAEGFGSLFCYCTGALRLAEHAAYNRIEAARASRRFPAILDLLADGSLNLSTVRLLAPHLRLDNFEALVAMAKGKSKREVEALVARLAPRPDVAASVRKLPASPPSAASRPAAVQPALASGTQEPAPFGPASISPAASLATQPHVPQTTCSAADGGSRRVTSSPAAAAAPERPVHRPVVTALALERYRVQFTVGEATHEKLRRVQDLLRREIPDGDPGVIFDRALTLLLEDVARKKLASASKPRLGVSAGTRSRHLPARVRRDVWLRDGGRCAFVAPNGRRCTERAFLEFHHREPYAIGGETTVVNISLRCRSHNAYEAELVFGSSAPVVRGVSAGRPAPTGHTPAERNPGAIREYSPRGELGAELHQVGTSFQPRKGPMSSL